MLFAQDQFASRGRKHPEPEDPSRTFFQRDRDRVIHSKAFRRLSGKTQVFVASYGDHYRSRLTHSIEVAQVSRDIARSLGLNEDLCEAIALAHDLGHTPFGHAGEEAMDEIMKGFGDRFEHNEQTLRVVEVLEKRVPEFPGLNLSMEVLEGLMKHRNIHHSLEAQVVDIADAIAYHHHDIDDGLRSGILNLEVLRSSIGIWDTVTEELDRVSCGEELYRRVAIGRLMSLFIGDIVEESRDGKKIRFSEKMRIQVEAVAEFLGRHFYLHERVTRLSFRGQKIIKGLFEMYSKHENLLPLSFREQMNREHRHVVIKDYISGMTDRFARARFLEFSQTTL